MPYSGGVKLQDEISKKIIDTVTEMVYDGGAANINVQMVLKKLKITNRVFYNRFKNIDEVLLCVSQNLVQKMHQCI
ncbi:MAG: TetR/AcrR family transcriptional regulator, partial [Elusimicrobiaceae bacterium]|nr:TetR/AcrR family transcriptional regulator [Elusimicrobiaceae bacterium]